MIEASIGMGWGVIVTKDVYRNGKYIPVLKTQTETIKTPTKQILMDIFFTQLKRMEAGEIDEIRLIANTKTFMPDRFELIKETHLD